MEGDGFCDDGGPNADYGAALMADCADCGERLPLEGQNPFCGDGIHQGGRGGDDGNQDGDGCSANCTIEADVQPFCGDGLWTREECDDGNRRWDVV